MTITLVAPTSGGGPGGTGAAGELACVVGQVRGLLAGVAELPTFGLSAEELRDLLVQVGAATSSLGELAGRLVHEADSRGVAKDAGCTSTTAWVRMTTGASGQCAGRLAALAREVYRDRVEATRLAWAAGRLTDEQALVIARAVNRLSPGVGPHRITAAQADLIDRAGDHTLEELRRLANRLVEVVDPDAAEEVLAEQLAAQERRALEATQLRFSREGDGTTRLSGRLPHLQAEMLKKALETLASPRRRSAREGQGVAPVRVPEQGVDSREAGLVSSPVLNPDGDYSYSEIGLLSHAQRLGRALMELVEHLPADRLPQAGGVNATVVVSMQLRDLLGGLGSATLDTGAEISAAEARRLACNATLVPMVLDGTSRILDLGLGQRLFDRHQRLALAARDGGCIWPGCARPPAWCEAHHLTPWSRGGRTDVDNGALACGFHHRLLHSPDWQAQLAADGVVEIIPPARVDPLRTPRRHARFRFRRTS
jgi:hypothetical protein